MVKKWVSSFDGHDIELVDIAVEPSEGDLLFLEEFQDETRLINSGSGIVYISREGKKGNNSSPGFFIQLHPTVFPHHPRYIHTPEQRSELSCSQIDKVLHVLGDYFPPQKWEVQL